MVENQLTADHGATLASRLGQMRVAQLGLWAAAAFTAIGFVQPILMVYNYEGRFSFSLLRSVETAVFFASFAAIIIALHLFLAKLDDETEPLTVGRWWQGILGQSVPMLTFVARIALTLSLCWASLKYVHLLYADKIIMRSDLSVDMFAFPKVIDRVVPFFDLGPNVYTAAIALLTLLSLAGLLTRYSFPLLWFICWYLVSHYEATSTYWSHGEAPILMTSLPLLCHDLRGRYYIGSTASKPRSPYLPLFLAQVFASLFFAGAFYAKVLLGGMAWIESDHLRNAYGIVWANINKVVSKPIWVDWVLDSQVLMLLTAYGHLLMQALPVLVILFPLSRAHRTFEGIAYGVACILLWAMMGYIWPWYWWLGIAAIFFPYDATAYRPADRVGALSSYSWWGLKYALIAVYIVGFATQVPAMKLRLYPFLDALSFYAVPYDTYPFSSDVAQIINVNGVAFLENDCAQEPECVFEKRRIPNDQNSPANNAAGNLAADEKLKLLEWCAANAGTFCSPTEAAKIAVIWTAYLNMDLPKAMPVTVGISALRTAAGDTLAVDAMPEAIALKGSLADAVSSVTLLEMSASRREIAQVAGGPIKPVNRVVPLPKSVSCLALIVVKLSTGESYTMTGPKRCSWRKV